MARPRNKYRRVEKAVDEHQETPSSAAAEVLKRPDLKKQREESYKAFCDVSEDQASQQPPENCRRRTAYSRVDYLTDQLYAPEGKWCESPPVRCNPRPGKYICRALLNPHCYNPIDTANNKWVCVFCYHINEFPPGYKFEIADWLLPATRPAMIPLYQGGLVWHASPLLMAVAREARQNRAPANHNRPPSSNCSTQ